MTRSRRLLASLLIFSTLLAACGGSDADGVVTEASNTESAGDTDVDTSSGLRVVSATDAASIQSDPPSDLVILDVRTPEEFAEGHLEGAIMLDFYEADFADQLAALDPDVPYLLYCRSGNRSGQTLGLMADLGFDNVADVDGGILAWGAAGLPTTR